MNFKEYVRDISHFPIPGVVFRDISPLLADPNAFHQAIAELAQKLNLTGVDAFAGIESRGFILAAALAAQTKKGFIALRKAGKLPPPTLRESYQLEYGEASLEVPAGKHNVVIVDDVLATGGTLQASIRLCKKAGYDVKDVLVLIDLVYLNQFHFQGERVKSLIQYEK